MSNTSRLRNLLDKYLNDTCSKSEMEELLNLIKRADNEPEIKQFLSDHWQEMSQIEYDDITDSMEEDGDWFHEIYSEALALEGVSSDADKPGYQQKQYGALPYSRKTYPWIKVAAVLLISLFVYQFYSSVAEKESVREVVFEQKTAEPGEKIRFILPDGTQVHLNSESSLHYPVSFEANSREVYLEGEAYFVVEHEESRPFLVHTSEVTTRVLGTSFNIRSYPEDKEVRVAVVSGKVALTNQEFQDVENHVILQANEWAEYSIVTHSFSTDSGDITSFTAWNENVLFYHDKELREVASELERWYGVTFSFDNEELKRCVIRGEHRNESLVNVLDAIIYAFDMEYQIDGRNVVLSGEGCR